MAELSKFMKIVLIIDIIAAFIYGIFYLFVPALYAGLVDPPSYDEHFWRLWGGTCVSLGIFGIIGFIRNEWTKFKVMIEFVMLWLLITNILNLASFGYLNRSAANTISETIDIIVIFFLIGLNLYAYLQENKK